jgi:hypothetical protein
MHQGHLLLLKIFKVKVLEIHWQLALYAMNDMPETSNIQKINQTEQLDRFCRYETFGTKIT